MLKFEPIMNDGPTDQTPSGTGQAYLLFTVCFVLAIGVGGSLQALSLRPGLAATLVFLILAPALIFIRSKGVGVAEGLRLRRVRPPIAVMSLFLGIGTWALGMMVARGLGYLGLKTLSQGLDAGLDSPVGFATGILVAAVGPGICEEAMFRGAIQGLLERKGKWFAVVMTAALFGLLHVMLGLAIPAALMGFFYGWVVMRTGSIVPAMLAHFANNAAALSFLYFLEGEDPLWLIPCLLIVGVVAIVSLLRLSGDEQPTLKASPLRDVPAALPVWGTLGCLLPLLLFVAMTVAVASALPYFITIEKLSDGEQIVYANRDSALFDPIAGQADARIVYTQEGQLTVGWLVEFNEESVTVRDSKGLESQVPNDDLQGVLVGR